MTPLIQAGVDIFLMFEVLRQVILICTGILPARAPSDGPHPRQAAHHTINFVFNSFGTALFLRVTYFGKPLKYGG